jgi:hypothetical protein
LDNKPKVKNGKISKGGLRTLNSVDNDADLKVTKPKSTRVKQEPENNSIGVKDEADEKFYIAQ